jgi:hypothetical protein
LSRTFLESFEWNQAALSTWRREGQNRMALFTVTSGLLYIALYSNKKGLEQSRKGAGVNRVDLEANRRLVDSGTGQHCKRGC